MFVPEYVHLAQERKSILVFPGIRRANIGIGVPVERTVLDVYGAELTVHSTIYMCLNEHDKKLRSTRNGAFFDDNWNYPTTDWRSNSAVASHSSIKLPSVHMIAASVLGRIQSLIASGIKHIKPRLLIRDYSKNPYADFIRRRQASGSGIPQ